VDVQRLALIDEGTPVSRHLDDAALRNLPHRLVQGFDVGRNFVNILKVTDEDIAAQHPSNRS